ncbi:protein tyrosine phosphatase domain-containing protein 1 isoform X8 [Fukomys damarensis]|uniref:protein tyrosine phosphatase domain-containing protein 1 isoform X8 n=1 Tax=Fukomys damarensis TaxID=885580 RepID=UPI00145516CF|nr:protein tyrosine phosphatase domain-containing protein 1 isoform X8 [Fukomys damarensis]
MQVQDVSRRPSAMHFLSSFLQGRRHSTSDPVVRLQQARRGSGSATKLLSSSSLQVMVAVSSVSRPEGNPTFPERKRNSGRPTPKYTKVGERLRHVIPGHMACSMACGGRACKYENPTRWSEQEQAIKGVYSSWVTDNILAMARPSSELLQKYHIIEQFLSHGIKTIINLQRPGEHASCGNSLEQESGFTYLPEAFMEAGIYFYNFGWKDYGVASLTAILDMVKVMTFALQEGKVAIHCHAGLGRTGVLIACYLVFATRMTADQAIIFVRAKRPNSIQTRGQLLCVREFTQFLTPLRNIFSCCDPKAHAVTLAQYLIRQRHLLHGYEARLLKHVPKIIHLVCKLLLDLAENRPVAMKDGLEGSGLSAEIEKTVSEMVTMHLDKELLRHHSDIADSFNSTAVATEFENQEVILSSEQEFDPLWKRRNVECLQPLTHLKRRLSYSDSDLKRAEALLEQGETPWTVPAQDLLSHSLQQQKPSSHCYTLLSPELNLSKETLLRNTFSFWNQSKCGNLEGHKEDGSPLCQRRAIPKEIQRSRTFSKELNSQDGAWERICGERDPFILCGLMWSWVEQLKEPVITKEDVDMLIDRQADAAEALFLLEKGQQQTILCVLHCIVNLQAIPVEVEEACLAHAIKAFTKVNFDSENGPIVYNTLKKIFKHTLEEKRKMAKDSPTPDLL